MNALNFLHALSKTALFMVLQRMLNSFMNNLAHLTVSNYLFLLHNMAYKPTVYTHCHNEYIMKILGGSKFNKLKCPLLTSHRIFSTSDCRASNMLICTEGARWRKCVLEFL